MSDKKDAPENARLVPGKATPTPTYHYQTYHGKSGSVSSTVAASPKLKIPALQNFVVNNS